MMFFPRGLREQPAWVCIGILFVVVGLGYLTGVTDSPIKMAVGTAGLRAWGGLLSATGLLLVIATVSAKPALEKLSLRFMVLALFVYLGYLSTVVPFARLAGSFLLGGALMLSAAFRIWHLTALLRVTDKVIEKVGDLQ